MEIKDEYKKTEIGLIPENWNVSKIQDLIDNKSIIGHLDGNHGALYPRSHEFKSFGVPYITANDFEKGYVDFKYVRYLSYDRAKQFKKGISKSGDVLFAHNATVGPTALLITDFEYVILSTTATYYRTDNSRINNWFLNYLLQDESFVKQYTAVMRQSTRNQVPITQQRKFLLKLPPLPEQQAIAEVLSDTDNLIQALEKQIAKKRLIKQGAMQKLLTPKEGWEVKKLGDIAKTYGGLSGKTKEDFKNGLYPYIPFMNILSNPIIDNTYFDFVKIRKSETQNKALKGDLFFNGSSETPEEVGMCSVLLTDIENLYLNSFCFGLRLLNQNEYYSLYLSYFFRSGEGRKLMFYLAQGATRYNLSKTNFVKLVFRLPNFKEQIRIATILNDMDTEISALGRKLFKAKQLKQGLMQNLLTGKIRLIKS